MNAGDTIAAISSAVGQAARMIVRLSGPDTLRIARQISELNDPKPGSAQRCRLKFAGLKLPGSLYFFTSPHSYSGEDIVEFHIPGNPLLGRILLDELVKHGARRADPGEFTARAYFNGRIDLSEAEGVAATIAAHSERELRAARQLMSGELSRRLKPILDLLTDLLALVEVGIDFTDEDVTFLSQSQLRERIRQIDGALEDLLLHSTRFETLAHEPQIVFAGHPNAGKSTLLNALAGDERAVVSDQAGTTRDAIWSLVRLPRGIVRIIDVAGLDQAIDEIGVKMQRHAQRAIESADTVVLVQDVTDNRPPPDLTKQPDLVVRTKLDLWRCPVSCGEVAVSALRGENLGELRARLDELSFGQRGGGATLALNARHVHAIREARDALQRASAGEAGHEVVALHLREALDSLGAILGSVSPDDVLGLIFSSFCIGK